MSSVTARPVPVLPVTTTDTEVPPLDEEIEDLAYDLDGLHPAIDQIRDGFLALARAPLTRDQTHTVLSALAGSEGGDIVSLLASVIQRLTSYDTNPALAGPAGLDAADADNARRIGEAIACDVATSFPRDLVGNANRLIDPYLNPTARTHPATT